MAKGVDFGRLLETQTAKTEDGGSAPPSRASSRQGSITSLSSFMTNDNNLSYDDPKEVDEQRSSGHVGGWVYKGYFSAGGNCCVIFTIFILCVMAQFFASAGDFFISEWVKMEEKSPVSFASFTFVDNDYISLLINTFNNKYIFLLAKRDYKNNNKF